MILYYAPLSCAVASHIALETADAKYEARRLDFRTNEQRSPAYLAVNPKGRVPALVTNRGVVTETPAILVYIAQTHPHANLAPLNDPYQFAQLQAFNSYLCATVHVAHAHRIRGTRWADDDAAIDNEEKSTAEHGGLFFADRERDVHRTIRFRRDLHHLRDLSLHTQHLARG